MANHASSIKRIRNSETKRLRNRYYAKTTRNLIKKLRHTAAKKEAGELLGKVSSLLDKLAKNNVIHHKKAGNLKGKLTMHFNQLK